MRVLGRGGVVVVAAVVASAAVVTACGGDESASRPVSQDGGEGAAVVRVIDGDTLDVRLGDREERVRLVGVNTPERGECLYAEASDGLAELVAGETVRLERDRSERDQYGRLLRYVFVDDTFVNEALVAHGLAISRAYPPDTTRQTELDAAQVQARDAGVGLWSTEACGRPPARADGLVIRTIEPDPPGDDTLVLNEEFLVIANEGQSGVSLAGWSLRDESSSHRFAFPEVTLGAGADVTVHSGCGRAGPADLYWCVSGSAIWNNDGDTAFLVDPAGNVSTSETYRGE